MKPFKGEIHTIGIWDKELTKKEIRKVFLLDNNFNWLQTTLIKIRWAFYDLKQFVKNKLK